MATVTRPTDAVIVSAARTPIGAIGGVLSTVRAVELGVIAVKAAIARAGLTPTQIEDSYIGNVLSAGMGQAPARQVILGAGCGYATEATTVNKVCASGLKAIMFAAQSIQLGQRDVVVAGGIESMSNVPYALKGTRQGYGYGHQTVEDIILADGLTDVYNKFHMGMCGENTAATLGITRAEQDDYALRSYNLAAAAFKSGRLAKEIVGVPVPQRKGDPILVTEDEEIFKVDPKKVPTLRSAFKKDGTITAANASKLNDGAAALVVVSRAAAERLGLKPLALIRGYADAAKAPIDFPIAPADAVNRILQQTGINKHDVAHWEVNEAFSVVALANQKLLGIDIAKINPYGGAVSLGHPIGSSGARIVGVLVHQLEKGQLGCASICNGGGGSSAIMIEKL